MIKVLIVEDSKTAQQNLKFILESDPEFEVIGIANNGEEALEFLKKKRPDVITMDVIMPKMNGFETTRIIMENDPIPIVIISASNSVEEVDKSFKTYEAGALALLEKPRFVHQLNTPQIRSLIRTVKTMSKVSLIKRWDKNKYKRGESPIKPELSKQDDSGNYKVIVIGASTGGPPALQQLLKVLPANFELPIVIVQHIALGFIKGMADWLKTECDLNVKVAENYEKLLPGNVYLAGDGYQLGIKPDLKIYFADVELPSRLKPSVSYLFESAGKNLGADIIAILLTGMGKDGSEELKQLKDIGALTFIQDEKSSIVFGMPGVAKKLDAHKYEMNPTDIGKNLVQIVSNQ